MPPPSRELTPAPSSRPLDSLGPFELLSLRRSDIDFSVGRGPEFKKHETFSDAGAAASDMYRLAFSSDADAGDFAKLVRRATPIAAAGAPHIDPWFDGKLSPRSAVTLTSDDSAVAAGGIPRSARSFCFAYPANGVIGLEPPSAPTTDEDVRVYECKGFRNDGTLRAAEFLVVGGFVYFDQSNKVVAVCSLRHNPSPAPTAAVLHFSGPFEFPSGVEWKHLLAIDDAALREDIEQRSAPVQVTLTELSSRGVAEFCWLGATAGAGDAPPLLSARFFPDGAFCYLYNDRRRSCFFKVVHKGVLLRAQHEQEADVQRERLGTVGEEMATARSVSREDTAPAVKPPAAAAAAASVYQDGGEVVKLLKAQLEEMRALREIVNEVS